MRDLSKLGAKINSKIGKAVNDYGLIADGDKILVAVSGGKDSLTLLNMLKAIRSWAPVKFDIIAAHIKTDFHCASCVHNETLSGVFDKIGIEYKFSDVKVLDDKGNTSCFWCSWNKRKALFNMAEELGCNKIAFGHHKDDIVETILLNLLYKGEISAMNPKQPMFGGKVTIIRPLCYVDESLIEEYAKESGFPSQLCKCPYGRDSQRKYIKNFISETEKRSNGVSIKTNIFKSVSKIKSDYIDLKDPQ